MQYDTIRRIQNDTMQCTKIISSCKIKSSIKISAQLSAGRPWKIGENISLVFKSSNVYTNLRLLIFFIISAILLTSTPTTRAIKTNCACPLLGQKIPNLIPVQREHIRPTTSLPRFKQELKSRFCN